MLKSTEQKNNKPNLIINQRYNLLIELDGIRQNIPYLPLDKIRILVGVATNPANENEEIIKLIKKKT